MPSIFEQQSAQCGTPSSEAGFDGAELDTEYFGDLFIGEAFDFAQDDDDAVVLQESWRRLASMTSRDLLLLGEA